MGNIVTNVYAKFNNNRLRIDKALGSFLKPDNNKNSNVRSAWRPVLGPESLKTFGL